MQPQQSSTGDVAPADGVPYKGDIPRAGSRKRVVAEPDPVHLVGIAGGPLLQRVVPVLGGLALLWVVYHLVRRD